MYPFGTGHLAPDTPQGGTSVIPYILISLFWALFWQGRPTVVLLVCAGLVLVAGLCWRDARVDARRSL